jgi:hypothetical protein
MSWPKSSVAESIRSGVGKEYIVVRGATRPACERLNASRIIDCRRIASADFHDR